MTLDFILAVLLACSAAGYMLLTSRSEAPPASSAQAHGEIGEESRERLAEILRQADESGR